MQELQITLGPGLVFLCTTGQKGPFEVMSPVTCHLLSVVTKNAGFVPRLRLVFPPYLWFQLLTINCGPKH